MQQIALEMQRDQLYNKQKEKSRGKAQDLGGDPEDKDMFIEETLIVKYTDIDIKTKKWLQISPSQMMTSSENVDSAGVQEVNFYEF